jgi:esterase/lipase superfamily enzyme
MGNRGLLRAVDKIAQGAAAASAVRFGQIILAAPDVDSSLFQQLAVAYGQLSQRSTLYVAENDRALGVSKGIHQFARAGRAPPVIVLPGVDTINVTRINLGLLGFGHGYAAGLATVLDDIRELLVRNTDPDLRAGLRRAGPSPGGHWEFA